LAGSSRSVCLAEGQENEQTDLGMSDYTSRNGVVLTKGILVQRQGPEEGESYLPRKKKKEDPTCWRMGTKKQQKEKTHISEQGEKKKGTLEGRGVKEPATGKNSNRRGGEKGSPYSGGEGHVAKMTKKRGRRLLRRSVVGEEVSSPGVLKKMAVSMT